ncbi:MULTISPECIES: hypothetical protein [unclassified Psychrobacter]|uniref:hypothetical protein n=1 Tax=unclassified Psychrobacter TaxID=196806 RepID=UPI0025D009DF|nr:MULTISPECIES: hypothetical protein [unclassified Psychrobacter]
MTGRLLLLQRSLFLDKNLGWTKYAIVLTVIAIPFVTQAASPTGFGTFTRDERVAPNSIVSGTYKTLTGATGNYRIIAGSTSGYNGVEFQIGDNGIMIKNLSNDSTDKDKFTYTFELIPDPNNANFINTIKIAQATYPTYNNSSNPSGNSEIARQTLDYVPNIFGPETKAKVLINLNASYYFGAMGDYFMGNSSGLNDQTIFTSNNPIIDQPQLRVDSTRGGGESGLYYYDISKLKGTNSGNFYTLERTAAPNKYVEFKTSDKKGVLPPEPTFENILKANSSNNRTTYLPYTSSIIPKNTSYVSYGVNNSDSNYVIGVENAQAVTLTYEGIMNGNSGKDTAVIGETFNEWISFGITSEVAPTYTFSGTVFNDNGGLTLRSDEVGTVNSQYFNGIFDSLSGEVGISNPNLAVRLTDCSRENTLIPTTSPQAITDTGIKKGQYGFSVSSSALQNRTKVCIVQVEPENWEYSVDSTTNKREVTLNTGVYNYNNLDFGEVQANNASLVLVKSQYVNNCDINANYSGTTGPSPQTPTFTDTITNIEPGKCIAYKIDAYNRGHVALANIRITDILQKMPVESRFHLPVASGIPASLHKTDKLDSPLVTIGENGVIITEPFELNKTSATTLPLKRTLYFNTKYGTTVNP